jgi:hypothetical protein
MLINGSPAIARRRRVIQYLKLCPISNINIAATQLSKFNLPLINSHPFSLFISFVVYILLGN